LRQPILHGSILHMEPAEAHMMRAIELARSGMRRGDGGPFGAVVVRDGAVIGEGWNRVLSTHDPTAHGEIMAIRDACARIGTHVLEGCEIFTTGEPCPMCLGAIQWARIRAIHHGFGTADAAKAGFDDREFHRQMALPAAGRFIVSHELCRAEALDLLDEFIAIPGHRIY
jgi:guanine deaminase